MLLEKGLGGIELESAIILLDGHTDQTVKMMLDHVVVRKRKFDRLKHRHLQSVWAAMAALIVLGGDIYLFVVLPYSYSFEKMFAEFIGGQTHFLLMLLAAGAYGYMLLTEKKRDKAEKEYQGLRKEIISKSRDLWTKEEEWKNRHKVFEMMKNTFDINLYHENK